MFKLKKTPNAFSAAVDRGFTAVFLLSKGCKSEFPGGLRQAFSSAGRLVHGEPAHQLSGSSALRLAGLDFFPPHSLGETVLTSEPTLF